MVPTAGVIALVACFMIMVIILAVLAMISVKALTHSPVERIPLRSPFRWRFLWESTCAICVRLHWRSVSDWPCFHLRIISGGWVAEVDLGTALHFTVVQLTWMLVGYGFVVAVPPVRLLLAPRDYLSTFLKSGMIVWR